MTGCPDEVEALRAIAVIEQGRVVDLDRATALEADFEGMEVSRFIAKRG